MPAAFMRLLLGIQLKAPDQAVVPPNECARSSRTTLAPALAAVNAAAKPAPPEPTTTTSVCIVSLQSIGRCAWMKCVRRWSLAAAASCQRPPAMRLGEMPPRGGVGTAADMDDLAGDP